MGVSYEVGAMVVPGSRDRRHSRLVCRGLGEPNVRASTNFTFMDTLADRRSPYLIAKEVGEENLANKINMVSILCDASETMCDMHKPMCGPPRRQAMALYVQYVVPYHEGLMPRA